MQKVLVLVGLLLVYILFSSGTGTSGSADYCTYTVFRRE